MMTEVVKMRSKEALGSKYEENTKSLQKVRKNDKTQANNKINNESKLSRMLKLTEQVSQDIKLLREQQHECIIRRGLTSFEMKMKP